MSSATDIAYSHLGELYARHPAGGPANGTFLEILRYYFSPEEARVASSMTFHQLEPEEAIARRSGMSLDEASKALTAMASRAWIRGLTRPDGVRVFRLLPMVPGLYEMPFYLREKTPDLERLGDLYDRYFHEGWGHELHGGKIQISRVLPTQANVNKEQVMPYEDVVKVLEKQQGLYLLPCVCRLAYGRCNNTVDVCISLVGPETAKEMSGHVPVFDPAYARENHSFRPISVDEGISRLTQAETEGLVHVCANVQDEPVFICNCCSCCCVLMRSVTELTIPFGIAPSSFWMTVDDTECNGCAACVERCPVIAITVEDSLATVDHDLCLGCGVCSYACPVDALHLDKRNANIFIPPADANEMYTIIGLDRGRKWPVEPHHHGH